MADNLDTRLYNDFGYVFPEPKTEQKRYRVQLQFDVYADNDKDAAELIGDTIYNIKNIHNSDVIYLAEAPFANMNHRKMDYSTLYLKAIKDRSEKLINDPLPF